MEPTIDVTLFKLLRMNKIFNQDGTKMFNFNVYRLIGSAIIVVVQSIIVVGSSGFFVGGTDAVNVAAVSEFVFFYLFNSTCIIKAITFVYKADDIWNLFDVIGLDFLTSELCRSRTEVLRKHRDVQTTLLISINVLSLTATVLWAVFPAALTATEWLSSDGGVYADDTTRHFSNIFNLPFPVTACLYNNYYILFYLVELTILMFLVYTNTCFNTFLISFSCVMTSLYETISQAYENVDQKQTTSQKSTGESGRRLVKENLNCI